MAQSLLKKGVNPLFLVFSPMIFIENYTETESVAMSDPRIFVVTAKDDFFSFIIRIVLCNISCIICY